MSSSFSDSSIELEVGHLRIPLKDIVTATNNYAEENLIKEGRSAYVYKGRLLRSEVLISVVIWKFNPLPWYQEMYFLLEIQRLYRLNHRNVASLIGFCDEGEERMIIMEHVVKGSLDKYLGDQTLAWFQRLQICYGAALAMSHFSNRRSYFCGIKSSKVLLDENWDAKVCCIRISLHKGPGSAPSECDEHSLGLMLFEVLSGKKLTFLMLFEVLSGKKLTFIPYEEGELDNMIAPYLRKQMYTESLSVFLEVAYKCLKKRLDFVSIAKRLGEALALQLKQENHVKNLVKNLACLKIPLSDITLATDDFSDTYLIKSHQHDKLYKADLDHNRKGKMAVIVKRIINHKYSTTTDFYAELEMLASCEHHNLVSLFGFCDEDPERILVFERSFEKTLDEYLGNPSKWPNLTWEQRIRICLDIANGMQHLHTVEGKHNQGMIHQGILSANVTLDENCNAKIANFRLSEFDSCATVLWKSRLENFRSWLSEANDAHLSEANDAHLIPLGKRFESKRTWSRKYKPGYDESEDEPPWYHESKDEPLIRPSCKRLVVDDIYSMGVILFEILNGRLAYDPVYMGNDFNGLACMARLHFNARTLKNMIDGRIMEEEKNYSYTVKKGPDDCSLDAYSKIAYQCVSETASERPTLEDVIQSLKKARDFQMQTFEHLKIPYKDIVSATNNFHETYRIGSGGYGEVYKTESNNELCETLTNVAIKHITRKDKQGEEGFIVELDVLTRCEHPNIVPLLGFCVEGSKRFLVYEYLSNGSLADYFKKNNMNNVTWAQRLKMCIHIAKGLEYLHTNMEDKERIIHRDVKSDNILLGENLEAKIADFGLSKVCHGNQGVSTINTKNVVGTNCYLDPEYARIYANTYTYRLKTASDIYSMGVVLFEIFSGKVAYDQYFTTKNAEGLAAIARIHFDKGTLKEILDPKLMKKTDELGFTRKEGPDHDSLDTFSKIAYKCLAKTQEERPTIDVVVKELEKALYIQENVMKSLRISLEHIKHDENYIMSGGNWKLYIGNVQYNNGVKDVAVKRFNKSSKEDGFLKEFEVLYKYQQENIISLVGYCKENFEKIIVYEHAFKKMEEPTSMPSCVKQSELSLDDYLNETSFSWNKRLKISIGIAKGMKFLHGGDAGKDVVIHRDLKSSNILVTEDWKAKICGFELALTYPSNKEIVYLKNDVVGSPGYCDPMYSVTHYLTKESDIYSLGVILFEILCGRSACPTEFRDQSQLLDVLVKSQFEKAQLEMIVFEGIKEQIAPKSLITFRRIAFQCLRDQPEERPTAGDVVVQLQKALEFQEVYEIRLAKLLSTYQEILRQSPESYSTTKQKREIFDIISKAILKDEKTEANELREADLHRKHKEILESLKSP